jgi:lysophospholipase L1-like esterase
MYNFAFIGDSLTNRGFKDSNGWVKLLHHIFPKGNMINYGYEGYTSSMLKTMIPRLIPNENIFFASILLGTNDCYSSSFVSPEQYKQNIEYIINYIYNLNPECIILLITPPICKLNNFINEYVNVIYKIVKENNKISIIDLHNNDSFGSNKVMLEDLNDGIHFDKEGHRKVYDNIMNTLKENYGHISFKHLKNVN